MPLENAEEESDEEMVQEKKEQSSLNMGPEDGASVDERLEAME